MDIPQLATILASTFDPNLREEAEKKLNEIHKVPGFVSLLLQVVVSNDVQFTVRQSGGIYLKNMVSQYWKERDRPELADSGAYFVISAQDKSTIRENIVEAVIHAPELIRLQLTVCVSQILRHDFPDKWPGVVDKVNIFLAENSQATWMGALLTLYQIVKKYEFKKPEERQVLHSIMQVLLPQLYARFTSLMEDVSQQSVAIQKEILKIFFALIQYVLPMELVSSESFGKWMHIFQTVVSRDVPQEAMEGDEEELAKLPWWKAKKWALHILCRVFERYGTPGSITKEYEEFSEYYCKQFAVSVTQIVLKVLDQYRRKLFVAPRVLQQSINYLKNGISNSLHWKVMRPHIQAIIQEVIFIPDIFEDFISPVTAAATLLHTAVSKRKQVLDPTMIFCVHMLNMPPDQRDPRQKDGALHMIGTLADVLLKRKMYRTQLENMLLQHVFPEFKSSLGYLRARACWVLHSFGDITFKNERNLATAVDSARLCLTEDNDPPVKVEAAIALQFLIEKQEESKKYIEPHVRQVILELLKVIRETENDDLTGVMQKLISTYGDQQQVTSIAVDIARDLAGTFILLLDGEDSDEKAVTAMGILNTLETMLNAMEKSREIVYQLEQVVISLIAKVLELSVMEFYEDILSIICTCTCFEISQSMWSVYYMLYEAFQRDAFDYFAEMMPCIHNYITVDTPAFLENPKNLEILYNMCKKMLTDSTAQEDQQCNAAKLLEVAILQCQGRIDEWLPFYVEAALERLTREVMESELRTMCLQVAVAGLIYNTPLLLSILEKLQFPNTQETVTAQFFSQWLNDHDCFFGIHDRKMYVLGFCALMDLPREVRPQPLLQCSPQILPALLTLFSGLKRAYENRGDDDEVDEDGQDGESDEDELASDEDEINEDDVQYIESLALKAAEHLDDDDVCEEETALENFTTSVDTEEIDEFIAFRTSLQGLQNSDPEWYSALTGVLNNDQAKVLQDVYAQAEQRKAALESRRIEQQGGYMFTSMAVPQTFNFGQ
ncbi:PREDICTED: importin-7-like [Acropora digitifera]|uniref:importin-7-like n=1 Tax=Acropora digitifera TaxID=70779 RepID=UPI00077A694B|nr:PREDICTED: importin-7-like [Acropora digitifera]